MKNKNLRHFHLKTRVTTIPTINAEPISSNMASMNRAIRELSRKSFPYFKSVIQAPNATTYQDVKIMIAIDIKYAKQYLTLILLFYLSNYSIISTSSFACIILFLLLLGIVNKQTITSMGSMENKTVQKPIQKFSINCFSIDCSGPSTI